MTEKSLNRGSAGFLPDDRIGPTPAAIPLDILERYRKLNDATGTISDILDAKGIHATIPASRLRPTISGSNIVGRAVTVRNSPRPIDPYAAAVTRENLMCEVECMHQADPGDVLVIEGVPEISNMGGIMATIAKRQGIVGAVVDGGVRDVGHSRSLGFPVWSKDVSPLTGKWRNITQEINGPVKIAGTTVRPGDLVVADETGVCFVPQGLIVEVLERCEEIDRAEEVWVRKIADGLTIPEFIAAAYEKFPYRKDEK